MVRIVKNKTCMNETLNGSRGVVNSVKKRSKGPDKPNFFTMKYICPTNDSMQNVSTPHCFFYYIQFPNIRKIVLFQTVRGFYRLSILEKKIGLTKTSIELLS